ncbi:hypothetical protein A2U01_0093455, partial [Trifolium medium]|nr:hypothetical protein [Trifolium medium]
MFLRVTRRGEATGSPFVASSRQLMANLLM